MKRTFCFIIAISIGFTMVSCTSDSSRQEEPPRPPPESPKIPEGYQDPFEEAKKTIAAKVNGVPISRFDLVAEMNAIARQYVKPGQKMDPGTEEKVRKEALDRLIWRELAVQEAKKQGMKAPADAVAEEMNKIRAEMRSEDAFRQNLAKSGITEEDLRRDIERNILVEMITEKEIFGKATVDFEEAKGVYERNRKSYTGPSGPMTFEEARPRIENELKTAAIRKREDEWVAALKKRARIEIAP
jgi:hypothetical protein